MKVVIQLITAASYLSMPWSNGRGVTEQIAISPVGATLTGGFDFRISRARVASGGPFSTFPECDRILVVSEGEGLVLQREGGRFALSPLAPFRFSGDDSIVASLAGGPINDFNVIFNRARVEATCRVLSLSASTQISAEPGAHFLFCARGTFICENQAVAAGDTLAFNAQEVHLTASEAVALHVRLFSHA